MTETEGETKNPTLPHVVWLDHKRFKNFQFL